MSTDNENTVNETASRNEFLASNAQYFAQEFAPLNNIFDNSGSMNIVSEETKRTTVVGIVKTSNRGAIESSCLMLKPDPESLRKCINTLSPGN